ncbi:two-component system, chemotaxis family, sensor kinase CheA [Acetitomaculum ruminis DSM 5522]|uniref:Chemotaxis protein CheA n=1 Tax=Acetitomaculum ruminis DSM 5522 TaxID=1120918 RepID=A0A1I0WCZ8_9FIRM|nr:chemotaxis protein CheA [Acetitomaculum ruminis]SFA86635.1 two-component system, chemotaxis family, sensor kinase CheA [Acetitomaculum ruminis DSM 5522]
MSDTDGMLDMYLFENGQLLENLQDVTLEKKDENEFDEVTINEFFRIMHTIKGSSAIMMFDNITKVAHKLEDVFYYLRESHPENVPHLVLVDHIFMVSDFISEEFDKIREGDDADGDPTEILEKIDNFLHKLKDGISDSGAVLPEENKFEEPQHFYIAPANSENSKYYRIQINFLSDTQMCNVRAYNAVHVLKAIAQNILYSPSDILTNEESSLEILANGFVIFLQTQSSSEELNSLLDFSNIESVEIDDITEDEFLIGFGNTADNEASDAINTVSFEEAEKIKDEVKENSKVNNPQPGDFVIKEKDPGKGVKLAGKKKEAKKQSFISVNVSKMDQLMDLISEIVISESVVLQNQDLKVPGLNLTNFHKAAAQLTKFTSELQDIIMSLRMMPLNNTFQKMNRIVFETSRKLGKDIELIMIGQDTEVDKNIIEHISDPLMHLIRNSVDHGIETKEERQAAGKDPKGTITLEAKNEGGKVYIIVSDDGKGLDTDKIYNKAREKGLIGNRPKDEFTDKEIFQFITLPGFSTKEKVSELSGRGVGMDVVVKNIQSVGGSLDITSENGHGSSMTLKIPLTLSIIEGIVLESGDQTFVIETSAIKEFLRLTEDSIITDPDGSEFIMIRGNCYPVIRLNDRYQLQNGLQRVDDGIVILAEYDDKSACIFVDRLVGEQEIVVKPIPSYIKKVKGLSGCTQLGDGRIALILDMGGFLS